MSQDEPTPEEPKEPEKPDERKEGWIPRPPKIESAADFVVIVFACTVAFILVALSIGVIIAGILGADIKSYFAILTSIITSVISALVGYLAGRSVSGGPPGPAT